MKKELILKKEIHTLDELDKSLKKIEKLLNHKIEGIEGRIQATEEHLREKCTKCEGTGKPRTKTGEPAKTGTNVKCKECFGIGMLGYKIDHMGEAIARMKKDISRTDLLLKTHINKKVVEIMVLEEDGKWGDYSGTFSISNEEEYEITIDKAEKHFNEYFRDGFYHQDKNFAIFILSPLGGKRLVKELSTKKINNMEKI